MSYNEDDDFVKVVENEDSDFMEFPKEDDGSVLLRTIQTQFPGTIGMKYKGPSGAWRAVREGEDAKLLAPKGGWGNRVYCLTVSDTRKRKGEGDEDPGSSDTKYTKAETNPLLKDLALIGIPYEATNNELKQYFEEKYGEVGQLSIKFDKSTGKSKGFGFIRFKNEDCAKNALAGEDYIHGRRIQVRPKKEKPIKMYVNALPEGTTQDDLKEYFSQYGEVTDAYIPKPFRSFAFFTFASSEDGLICLRQQHVFKGCEIKVRIRKEVGADGPARGGFGMDGGRGGFGRDGGRGGFGMDGGRGGFGMDGRRGGFGRDSGRGGFGMGGGRGSFGMDGGRGGEQGGGRGGGGGFGNRGRGQGGGFGPPAHAQAHPQAAAELKNMLFQFLSG